MTTLSLAKPGKSYTIKWNVCQNSLDANTIELGLYPGTTLFVIGSYFGNVIVSVHGKKIALNKETAFCIKV